MKSSLENVSAQDILKLPTPNLEKIVEVITNISQSLEFENKLHGEGLLYFHLGLMLTGGDDQQQNLKFSRFRFRRHLGRGRYGVVVEVEDTMPDPDSPTLYAMKIQHYGDEFRRELKILAQFNSNRILKMKKDCYGFFNGLSWLVAELCAHSVADWLAEDDDASLFVREPTK